MSGPNEAQTRKLYIDKALARAEWHVSNANQVGIEIPVDGFAPEAWQRLNHKLHTLRESGVSYDVSLPRGSATMC